MHRLLGAQYRIIRRQFRASLHRVAKAFDAISFSVAPLLFRLIILLAHELRHVLLVQLRLLGCPNHLWLDAQRLHVITL